MQFPTSRAVRFLHSGARAAQGLPVTVAAVRALDGLRGRLLLT